jgi:hypothetical protein
MLTLIITKYSVMKCFAHRTRNWILFSRTHRQDGKCNERDPRDANPFRENKKIRCKASDIASSEISPLRNFLEQPRLYNSRHRPEKSERKMSMCESTQKGQKINRFRSHLSQNYCGRAGLFFRVSLKNKKSRAGRPAVCAKTHGATRSVLKD